MGRKRKKTVARQSRRQFSFFLVRLKSSAPSQIDLSQNRLDLIFKLNFRFSESENLALIAFESFSFRFVLLLLSLMIFLHWTFFVVGVDKIEARWHKMLMVKRGRIILD